MICPTGALLLENIIPIINTRHSFMLRDVIASFGETNNIIISEI